VCGEVALKSSNLKTKFVGICGIIGCVALLLVLLCTDATQQALGSDMAQGLVVAVDSKGKSGTKNQKGGAGSKGQKEKTKSRPGGRQAKAEPAESSPGGRQAKAEPAESSWTQDAVQLEQRIRRARSYAASQDYAKAEQELRLVLTRDPKNFAAYNNLGNVYFLQGNLDSAEVNYFKALPWATSPDDNLGVRLNLGALFYFADSQAVAEEIISPALSDSSDLDRVEQLLGLSFESIKAPPGDSEARRLSPGAMKSLVLAVFASKRGHSTTPGNPGVHSSDTSMAGVPAPHAPITPEGSELGLKKLRTRPGGSKGRRPPDMIEDVFFWAPASGFKAGQPIR
jgi:Flp pilus assembly protein TadD